MARIDIPLSQWLPDRADANNPGLVVAENVYPVPSGYGPFQGAAGTGDTTTEPVLGAAQWFKNDDSSVITGGSETRLFVRDNGGVTETSGFNALTSGSRWRFERFNNRIIAVSPENDPQTLDDVNTDTSWAALSGSPPRAAVVGRVSDFLMFGDLTDIDASTQPHRVRWSPLNNPTGAYVSDLGEQSDYRTLDPRFGRVTGVVSGRTGLVFQERAIYRVEYVGAPRVFRFNRISEGVGCIAPDSIVRRGFLIYFLSHEGFSVTNGSDVQQIGGSRINVWFANARSDAALKTVQGAINWNRRSVVWNFRESGGEGYTRQVVYNFEIDRWSSASLMPHWLVQAKIDGTSLDDLTTLYPGGIGDVPEPIGSEAYLPRGLGFSAFVPNGNGSEYAILNGQSLAAELRTGDAEAAPGGRTAVTGLRPVVEATTGVTTQVLARDAQAGTYRVTAETAAARDGWCKHRANGVFVSGRVKIAAGTEWDNASTLTVEMAQEGMA